MVKYGTIWKSTLREIRHSLGRFMAILAIVALGVGFFSGLKVTRAAMVDTVQEYLEDMNFYDYRLLCTCGFDQKDVEFMEAQEDVEAAEGAISFDALYRNAVGTEGVVRFSSLTRTVNSVAVVEGRLPNRPDECVVDSKFFGKGHIGEKLTLSENNDEDTMGHFSREQYTIVGRVQSPLYIQFERGNSSLGTGRIDGFVYLLRDGFDEKYYTDLYVKFREDMPLYSEEYKDFIQEKDPVWEELARVSAEQRFERLKADAWEEYEEARQEFETEKADAQAELADAKRKLEDGVVEIADAEEKLADARREVKDGERELASAKRTLANKEKELAEGERKLADARAEWDAQKEKVEAGRRELAAAEEDLKNKEKLLSQKKADLSEGELAAGMALMFYGFQNIDAARAARAQGQAQLDALKQRPEESGGDFASILAGSLAAQQIFLLESTLAALDPLIEGYEEIEKGRAALNEAQAQIQGGWKQIADSKAALEEADKKLEEAQPEFAEAQRELEDGKLAIADARKELAEGEQELAEAREKLAEGERELADAKAEYADGVTAYEDGQAEYEQKIADAEVEFADARKEIESLEEPDSYVLGRDTNVGYVCFESDSGIVDGIANVFPVFFFLVAALVCITTMNRMVEEQRTQIGVLKALGYGESVVMLKYIFYSGSAALIGCVLGFFGGIYIFPKTIWAAYGIMYSVGDIKYVIDWNLAAISVLVSLLCSVGTTWLSCRVELSQVAAQLMRPKAPKAGKRVFLEWIPFLWKHLSFLRKVSVRNIFRYKKRLFMMVMGISGCTALLVTGFGIKDSIAGVANQQFEEIQVYDVGVILTKGLDPGTAEKLDRAAGQEREGGMIADQARLCESSMDIVTEEARKSVYAVVFPEGADVSPFLKLHTVDGDEIAYPGAGEAVLSHKIAGQLGVGVGDTIRLENDDMRSIEAVVTAINENFIYNYVYLSEATYAEYMGGPPEYKSLYINAAKDADVHQLSAALMGVEGVAGVTVNEDVLARVNRMLGSMDLIVVLVIVCAGALAFIVLYNLTNINITERVREIATIKVLGFYRNETASYVFRENALLTLMGAIPGLWLGKWLHGFVMSQIKVDMVAFDVRILPQSYLYSLVFTFLFAWFVNRIMGGTLEKISMTESLKSVD